MSEKNETIEITTKQAHIIKLENWLIEKVAEHLMMEKEQISKHEELVLYGLDSMSAVMISGEIEEKLNIELPSTILWDYPTIDAIVEYLKDKL